ncbi:hypothetical protein FRC09_017739, partial [Ceratobasidium sp. 395]
MSTPTAFENPSLATNSSLTWPDEASVEVNKLINQLLGTSSYIRTQLFYTRSSNPLRDDLIHTFGIARSLLVAHIDHLDFILQRLSLPTKKPCPKSCPGIAPPSVLFAPVKLVDHKSISTEPPAPSPTPVPPASTVTYATIAAGSPPAQASHPKPKPLTRKGPVAVLKPIRLIIRRADPSDSSFPLAYLFANGPSDPYRRLRLAMAFCPATKDTPLLGLHRNRRNNVVVSLPHGTPDRVVEAVSDLVKTNLGTAPGLSRSFPLLVTRD